MSEGWTDQEIDRIDDGMALLGWRFTTRATNDDSGLLGGIAEKALSLQSQKKLIGNELEKLSGEAYDILWAYIASAEWRAQVVSDLYVRAPLMEPVIPLVDEATLSYFRGYFTAAFATLTISLEAYLRRLTRWQPGDNDPTFSSLSKAVETFPESKAKGDVIRVLKGFYGRYEALRPTAFHFNRHRLLHGIEVPNPNDDMNCGRMFVLLDDIVAAEVGQYSSGYVWNQGLEARISAYSVCVHLGSEKLFLKKV
jgi:hypothetical protein